MRQITLFVFVSIILFVSIKAEGQQLPVHLRFNKYTTENGLSDNYIYDIIKDKKGYLWMCTQHGINRFDGVDFKTFVHNPADSNSLLNNFVNSLVEDSMGRIWCATAGGLSRYDPGTGKFWNYIPPEKEFIASRVYAVVRSKDGSIWFSTKFHMHTVDLKSLQLSSFPVDTIPADRNNPTIVGFYEDHNGDFWFNSYLGLCLFNRKDHSYQVIDKAFGLSAFYDDGSGSCWIGSWYQGLRKYDFATKKSTDFYFDKKEFGLTTRDVVSIERVNYPGLESYLWIGTDNELAVFDLQTEQFVNYYRHDPAVPNSLPAGFINKVFYADGNEIWLATKSGLHYVRLSQLAFQTFTFPGQQMSEVTRIREDVFDPAHLWIALFPNGLLKLDKRTGNILQQYTPQGKDKIRLSYVYDFIQDHEGIIWISNDAGLTRYQPATKQSRTIQTPFAIYKGTNALNSLHLNADNTIWFSSDKGFGKFYPATEKFRFYGYRDEMSLRDQLLKDSSGNLWLAQEKKGLLRFDPETENLTRYELPYKDMVGASSYSMAQAPDNTIWFTNGQKLFFLKKDDPAFQSFSDLKIDGTIYKIVCDSKGKLFIGAQTGMFRYEPSTSKLTKFTSADGLYENKLFQGMDAGTQGELYLRGQGYITIIDPDKLKKNYLPAPLIFESFNIALRDTIIDFNKYTNRPLSLSYRQNQFTVHFRLLHYQDAPLVHYAYKLEGWDKDWISSGTGNYASYSNLDGGDYVLHVKAINPDGIENPEQAMMMIHIDTPFWETTWFRALCLVAAAALGYLIYRLRIQRLLAVHRIRIQISRDLHDEIGSSLSSMQIMSAFAEDSMNGSSPDSQRWVKRIGVNTKEIMEKMRDIVWTLNSSHDISGNIITRMNQFIAHTLEPKDIDCSFDADEKVNDVLTDFVRKRNVYLIFKEAVNNAAKYSDCTAMNISLLIENRKLVMTIADNGKGFDSLPEGEVRVGPGNGLLNMQQRAVQMHGKLEIISGKGKGTTVALILPLPQLRYRLLKKTE